jgi:hypothetical protein
MKNMERVYIKILNRRTAVEFKKSYHGTPRGCDLVFGERNFEEGF